MWRATTANRDREKRRKSAISDRSDRYLYNRLVIDIRVRARLAVDYRTICQIRQTYWLGGVAEPAASSRKSANTAPYCQ